jgi:hypothetical protein
MHYPPQHQKSRPPTHPATRPRRDRGMPRGYRTPNRAPPCDGHGGSSPARRASWRAPCPLPEQWAQQQLKSAPTRSRAWAQAVAAIYGLDVREE